MTLIAEREHMQSMVKVVLACGDREWTDAGTIRRELQTLRIAGATVLVHGAARGADSLAADVGARLGYMVRAFPADWAHYGRAAGPRRNAQMLTEGRPHFVLAFHDFLDQSRGTADMVRRARDAGVRVRVVRSAQR